MDHGGPSAVRGLEARAPRSPRSQEAATPGSRGTGLSFVRNQDDDCKALKRELEEASTAAGLRTRSQAGGEDWQVVNRIVSEELEAWYFGDWQAVRNAFPRVSERVPTQARYRDPDAIDGTWEAFERILKSRGYFSTGLRKVEAAQAIAKHIEPDHNRSGSFNAFHAAVAEAAA